MKRVNEATKLPAGVLSVQLFVPDMFGNDILVTRQEYVRSCPRNNCRRFNRSRLESPGVLSLFARRRLSRKITSWSEIRSSVSYLVYFVCGWYPRGNIRFFKKGSIKNKQAPEASRTMNA